MTTSECLQQSFMSHAAMLLIALATFGSGILVWCSVFAVSVQKTSATYEACDGRISNNVKNMTCTGSYHESSGITLNDLIQRSTDQRLIHNDTTANLYSHNTNIPFLPPFPQMFINVRNMNRTRDQLQLIDCIEQICTPDY